VDRLTVSVLGPLQVHRDHAPVRLGPRQSELMSLLLLASGQVVPAERLARLLWHHAPPSAARVTLRSHIAHLRRALDPHGHRGRRILVTVGTGDTLGYRLDVPPERIDAYWFERAYRQGRQLIVDRPRQADRAATLLAAGLALWRGSAYAEIADRPVALAERTRLAALHRATRRSHAEALSLLGRHVEVIGELTDAIAQDPDDEGVRRLLVRALYAEHRLDEATAVCREGLTRLARLGIAAPELAELQRAILRRDPPTVVLSA
jgi:DNA-binding SARP family transcriptional activator